jgi:hypothetical protein
VPWLVAGYNSYIQIFQTPNYVAILQEMIHDVRIVPLDGRPHVNGSVRLWNGDSRGRFEGDTLVVTTTNYSPKTRLQGSSENLKLVERFRRVSPDTLEYRLTFEDPTVWTTPWTMMIPLKQSGEKVYEYACHEGNHSLTGILAGARTLEEGGRSLSLVVAREILAAGRTHDASHRPCTSPKHDRPIGPAAEQASAQPLPEFLPCVRSERGDVRARRPLIFEEGRPVVAERGKPRPDCERLLRHVEQPLIAPEGPELSSAAERHVPFIPGGGGRTERTRFVPEGSQHLHSLSVVPDGGRDGAARPCHSNHLGQRLRGSGMKLSASSRSVGQTFRRGIEAVVHHHFESDQVCSGMTRLGVRLVPGPDRCR